jgi:regulatory protein
VILLAKLTKITTQKKNKGRYNIFLDHGQGEAYGFSVDEDVLVKYRLQKNMELDEATIEAMKQTDTIHRSYTLAINYLSYRMRSEKEIREYLNGKEVDPEHVEEIVTRSKVMTSSKGPLLLKKELIEKGVNASQAEEALQHFSFEKQYEKAMKFAEKKMKNDGRKAFRQQLQNVQQTLMQKGYQGDVIQEVLANLPAEENEDSEWEAAVLQGEKLLRKYQQKAEGFELKQKIKSAMYRKGFTFDIIDRFIEEYCEQ